MYTFLLYLVYFLMVFLRGIIIAEDIEKQIGYAIMTVINGYYLLCLYSLSEKTKNSPARSSLRSSVKIPIVGKFLYFFELETGGKVIGWSSAAFIALAWFLTCDFNKLMSACFSIYKSLDVVRGTKNVSMKKFYCKYLIVIFIIFCSEITSK